MSRPTRQAGDSVDFVGSGSERSFRVLVVCTANRYRSPLAEHFLRRFAQELGLDWAIESAGTRAEFGDELDPAVVEILRDRHVLMESWASRPLAVDLLERADLVLAAAQEHRGAIVAALPRAMRHTFLLGQFARFLRAAPAATHRDGHELIRDALTVRGSLQPVAPGSDDIPDPYGRSLRMLRTCADQLETAAQAIVLATRVARDGAQKLD